MNQQTKNPTSTTDSQGVSIVPKMTLLLSLRDFTIGLLKRWYLLVPALTLTPLAFIDRFTSIEWDPPVGLLWATGGVFFFIAAWLTYREVWVDPQASRLAKLLRLKREGEALVVVFGGVFLVGENAPEQGQAKAVASVQDKVLKPWLERVRDNLTAGELNVFDGDPNSGSILDIDLDLITEFNGLAMHMTERVNRIDDICEGIRHAS